MTRPTVLDIDLVVVPQTMTPEMIAAAWATWHSRHGGKIGPGPAFGEAVPAAISASPYPTAWDDVRKYVEGLELELASADAMIAAQQKDFASNNIRNAEIERLRLSLSESRATGRREGLSEAAKIAAEHAEYIEGVGKKHPDDSPSRDRCFARARSCLAIAAAIRAAMEKGE